MRIGAENKLPGKVKSIEHGAVNSRVVLELEKPQTITANVSKEVIEELGLKEGSDVSAVIKASMILLGVCQEGRAGCHD